MFDEREWAEIEPCLMATLQALKDERRERGATLDEVERSALTRPVLELHEQLTGFQGSNYEVIWHHRLSLFGPPCHACGRLLRTKEATRCASCGTPRN